MKLIPLTGKHGQGMYAQVDDEDYERLIQWKWNYHKTTKKNGGYVVRNCGPRDGPRTIGIHREVLSVIDKNIYVDHIDGNTLNNQRSNIRVCSHGENMCNKKGYGKSKYTGVVVRGNGYAGQLRKNGKTYAKYYRTEIEAALWYNEKAKEMHGEFAKINIIEK